MIVLTATAVLVVLRLGAPIFGPIALSILLAYVLNPLVGALMRVRVPPDSSRPSSSTLGLLWQAGRHLR
jgi:predicted PurR-regulated permease PerM